MKKLLIVLLVGVAGLVGYNYVSTGELKLLPGPSASGPEGRLRELAAEFEDATRELGQAGRAAGMTGLDTTADFEAARRDLERIRREVGELTPELESERARDEAKRLTESIRDYVRQLG